MLPFVHINYIGKTDANTQNIVTEAFSTAAYAEYNHLLSSNDIFDNFEYEISNGAIEAYMKYAIDCTNDYIEKHNSDINNSSYLWLDATYKIIVYGFNEFRFIDTPQLPLLYSVVEMLETYFHDIEEMCEQNGSEVEDYFYNGPELIVIVSLDLIPKDVPSFIVKISL